MSVEDFGYRYITSSMGHPELAINQNTLIIYILSKGIEDRDLTAPPGSPVDGTAYIPAFPATGVWAGHEDHIAYWFAETGVWKFIIPTEGLVIYVNDENVRIQFLGASSGWDALAGGGSVTSVSGAGTVAGLTLTGTVTGAGSLTLGGTLAVPVANITPSTSQAIGVGSIELGHATDTSITRVSAGVVAIEGVNVVTTTTNKPTESIMLACSDETTALTTGTAKVTFRMPYAFTLTAVRASVTTAPTGASLLTVDINESGSTILSTKLTFDASEKTTTTATTPAVISDFSLADDAEITIDIDQVGSTIAGAGLKVYLIGNRT